MGIQLIMGAFIVIGVTLVAFVMALDALDIIE